MQIIVPWVLLCGCKNINFPSKIHTSAIRKCSSPCDIDRILMEWYTGFPVTVQKCSIQVKVCENNRAPLLYYTEFCASFQIHWWIQTGVTIQKHAIGDKIGNFFVPCDLEKFDRWLSVNSNWGYSLYMPNSGQNLQFFYPMALNFDGWPWNIIGHLLCHIKLWASFHCHIWIQTGVTVRKLRNWVLTSETLTFDLWPWPFSWTWLLSMVISSENIMMIWWGQHS